MRPNPVSLTPAPLRNRIRVELDAPPSEVWRLIGDLSRFPEYSAGLERVDATLDAAGRCAEYVCHFKPMADGEPGIVEANTMPWYEPNFGYASSGPQKSAFGLRDDLNLLTLEASPKGTLVTWDEYFDAEDVNAMQASFDDALGDISQRLVARFGGRVLERFAGDGTAGPTEGPERVVSRLAEAINRGDLDAASALYEGEAVLMAQRGQVARGPSQIRQALAGFLALRPTLSTTASRVIESGDLALYLGRWNLSGVAPDGGMVIMGGESSDVLRRNSDGRWLIAVDNPWGTGLLTPPG